MLFNNLFKKIDIILRKEITNYYSHLLEIFRQPTILTPNPGLNWHHNASNIYNKCFLISLGDDNLVVFFLWYCGENVFLVDQLVLIIRLSRYRIKDIILNGRITIDNSNYTVQVIRRTSGHNKRNTRGISGLICRKLLESRPYFLVRFHLQLVREIILY